MPTGAEEIAAIAKAVDEVLELAKKQGWLDKVRLAFAKKHRVLVFGSTGVGKTQFIGSLTELITEAIEHTNRTSFPATNSLLLSDQPFVLIDTPGESGHVSRVKEVIRKAMAHGIDGVINVVSYGYHEYNRDPDGSILDQAGQVLPSFLADHREQEITALGVWNDLLGDRSIAKWLMTVVTKADLWWDERWNVLPYYKSGPYNNGLGDARDLEHVVLPYCSTVHRFYNRGGVSRSFDDSDRFQLRLDLIKQLISAVKH